MIGETLGHYQLVEKIGQGGMGVVYKAYAWHESPMVHLLVGWDWEGMRSEPRYQALLRRMNFPP